MMKVKRKSAGRLISSLLLPLSLLIGTAVPVSAATEPVAQTAGEVNGIISFWTDLMEWLVSSCEYCASAYYVPGVGLTLLGTVLVSLFALVVVAVLVLFLLKLFHFSWR